MNGKARTSSNKQEAGELFSIISEIGAQVDLEDALNRFIFDNTCTVAFSFDPNCLPKKFRQLREIANKKSFTVMDEVMDSCLWKQQKWIHVKKVSTDSCISAYFKCQELNKCSSSEEIVECYFDGVKIKIPLL
ncbi:putative alkane 1-monooxygenase [Medicago truncatula]|uniref:Putative alkane 1-monooxygenase n=1 Tax=Medicago truncatula TaxID=3880 RepID=A0A396JLI2_MEDTR|nr:putative alkane 1-monooxygenase [Medicago truncatula]